MARPQRPASDGYHSVCCSVAHSASYSSEAGIIRLDPEDDQLPIFSISKSSMDVVMASDLPHKRDPAWTRLDIRRSSSATTNAEQNSVALQQLQMDVQRIANTQMQTQCWSVYSGSTYSRSSTPDTIVCPGGTSQHSNLNQETHHPSSKLFSPANSPSSFISPLHTPTLPLVSPLTQRENLLGSSPAPSPNSIYVFQSSNTDDEGLAENNSLSFQFPSSILASVSLAETNASLDVGCAIEVLNGPKGLEIQESKDGKSPTEMMNHMTFNLPPEGQESSTSELQGQSCQTGQVWTSPLVSSSSDSRLGNCCRCNLNSKEDAKMEMFREEGTMTSQLELVDAEVQTMSPCSSWWDLKRNLSTSNMGSHSILGSPPGSRLNLKSSVGSISNLVSPSSSMFPTSSEDEEKQQDTMDVKHSHNPEWRRSCLKNQGDDKEEMGRRSSMKQVQWDEDGMTWDIHGASVDPEELNMAIQKHLEVQNSPRPLRPSMKKRKAPKPPVKIVEPQPNPPVVTVTPSPCAVKSEGGETSGEREVEKEGGGEKKEDGKEEEKEEDEVYGGEGTSCPKSPSRDGGSCLSRKKSVIRSLRRPRWCGSSRKTMD